MNNNEFKNIDIVSYLSSIGIEAKIIRNNKYWYNSPLRNEKTPSFKVDSYQNLWYDFGNNEGGDIIALVCKLHNVDFIGATKILLGNESIIYKPTPMSEIPNDKSMGIKIKRISAGVNSYMLISYLEKRGINTRLIRNCQAIKEVEFESAKGKIITTIGFRNDLNGMELRNSFIKLSTSPKSITTIEGTANSLNIFEGFMDYLSALTYYKSPVLKNTSIILNGTGQVKSILPYIDRYEKVFLFLDNDTSGIKCAKEIENQHKNVENASWKLFPKHKDFNDFILNVKMK